MSKVFGNVSLSREYYNSAAIVISVVILISAWLSYSTYRSLKEEREHIYISESVLVTEELDESFRYLEKSLSFISNKIAHIGLRDRENVAKQLLKSSLFPRLKDDVFTWNLFDFIDTKGYEIADSIRGVFKNPVKIDEQKRLWLQENKSDPWKLHFYSPAIGLNVDEEIVPVGYGVTDENDNYIGIVSVGFNIKKFSSKIKNLLGPKGTAFIILDNNLNIIAQSNSHNRFDHTYFKKHYAGDKNFLKNNYGKLNNSITFNGSVYYFYRKVQFSPYTILIGDTIASLKANFYQNLAPQIYQTISMGIFFIVFLYFFRRKIVNPILELSNAADKISRGEEDIVIPQTNSIEMNNLSSHLKQVLGYTKELRETHRDLVKTEKSLQKALKQVEEEKKLRNQFMANLAYGLKVPAQKIINHSEYLVRNISLSDPDNPLIKGWSEVSNTAKFIQTLVLDLLDYAKSEEDEITLHDTHVDIRAQIISIMDLLKVLASQGFVEVQANFDENLPYIRADELRIKQVLSNLISNAIIMTNSSGSVSVSAYVEKDFIITIKDQRYKKNEHHFDGIENPFYKEMENLKSEDSTIFGFVIAKKLIELHDGTISESTIRDEGEVIKITIPKYRILRNIS